jgi:hypothetical protein
MSLVIGIAGAGAAAGHGGTVRSIDASAFQDNCTGEPGYGDFRARFERVVQARDAEGLRALFDPGAAMRVNGIGGRRNPADWNFDRPDMAGVWKELDEILRLGCARSGEQLVLPAMAAHGELEPGQVIVLREETMRVAPQANARGLRRIPQGQVMVFTIYDTDGWTEVVFGDQVGYLPTASLRTTGATRLELVRFEASWRIREFGSGV